MNIELPLFKKAVPMEHCASGFHEPCGMCFCPGFYVGWGLWSKNPWKDEGGGG